jgi:hypothetical protein
MSQSLPVPGAGRLTFDAEGQEGGPWHSRRLHVPGAASGLTLGRGYDMKNRTNAQIRNDLLAAGVDAAHAALIAQASGLTGDRAEDFIQDNDLEDFEITPQAQLKLFQIDYDWHASDARRLATKPDVTRRYGATDWDALHPAIRDVVIDLRFRGDYSPRCREILQSHIVANNLKTFSGQIGKKTNWPSVPKDRFERRRNFCQQALQT